MKNKAFEVVINVHGGYKDQTRIAFVEAPSMKALKELDEVKEVFLRKDMAPSKCPEILDTEFGFIESK